MLCLLLLTATSERFLTSQHQLKQMVPVHNLRPGGPSAVTTTIAIAAVDDNQQEGKFTASTDFWRRMTGPWRGGNCCKVVEKSHYSLSRCATLNAICRGQTAGTPKQAVPACYFSLLPPLSIHGVPPPPSASYHINKASSSSSSSLGEPPSDRLWVHC